LAAWGSHHVLVMTTRKDPPDLPADVHQAGRAGTPAPMACPPNRFRPRARAKPRFPSIPHGPAIYMGCFVGGAVRGNLPAGIGITPAFSLVVPRSKDFSHTPHHTPACPTHRPPRSGLEVTRWAGESAGGGKQLHWVPTTYENVLQSKLTELLPTSCIRRTESPNLSFPEIF